MITDNQNCLIRLNDIIGPTEINGGMPLISISRSGWLTGVREGRFPKPLKLSPKVTVWKLSDIQKLISDLEGEQNGF